MLEKAKKLCQDWHEVGRADFEKRYENVNYNNYEPKKSIR